MSPKTAFIASMMLLGSLQGIALKPPSGLPYQDRVHPSYALEIRSVEFAEVPRHYVVQMSVRVLEKLLPPALKPDRESAGMRKLTAKVFLPPREKAIEMRPMVLVVGNGLFLAPGAKTAQKTSAGIWPCADLSLFWYLPGQRPSSPAQRSTWAYKTSAQPCATSPIIRSLMP